jgi:LysM repeat protein
MIRPLHFLVLVVALAAGISFLNAQDSAPSPVPEDIHAMRQMIEQQTLKIEALSQQIAKLNQQLEAMHVPAPAATSTPSVVIRSEPAPKAEEVKPVAEAPKAEPVAATGLTHVVARGETLTSIAKHYKTSVADLLKANKIEDDRKLQIGQVLIIPTPKEPEAATTKKEID